MIQKLAALQHPTSRLILSHNSRSVQRLSNHTEVEGPSEENIMPKMSDSRRKRIQAKQRKATNAVQRAAKLAKTRTQKRQVREGGWLKV